MLGVFGSEPRCLGIGSADMTGLMTLNTRTNLVSRDMEMAAWRDLSAAWLLVHNDPDLVRSANSEGAKTIYRQDPDKSLPVFQNGSETQAHAEAFVQTRLEKGAYRTHLTNEIVSSPGLQKWTKFALEYTVRVGGKSIPFNFGTHAARWQWEQSEANVRFCIEHDIEIGVHIYLDGKHDDTAYEWLWLKQKYGGNWAITEFNYIVDYEQGELGPLGVQSDEQHAAWLEKNVTKLIEKVGIDGLVICYFSFDPWPPDEDKRDKGFGAVNRPKTLAKMADLNKRYLYMKGKPAMPPVTYPPLPVASDPRWKEATIISGAGVNVRSQPVKADGNIVGSFSAGNTISVVDDHAASYPDPNGSHWLPVKLSNSVIGWSRDDVFTYALVTKPPVTPTESVTILKADYDAAMASLESAIALLKGAKPSGSTGGGF